MDILKGLRLAVPTVVALLTFWSAAESADFPVRSFGKPFFLVDAVALPSGSDSARVDLTWEVPYRELVFRREEEYYRARYDVGVVLSRGNHEVFAEIWDRRVRTRSFSETRESGRQAKVRKVLRLPSGRYEVRITLTDRASLGSSQAVAEIDADFGDSRIGLSDLRFVRYTEDDEVIPNPAHDVPVGQPGHFVRLTLHPEGGTGGVYLLKWRLESTGRDRVAERDTSVVVAGEAVPFEFQIPSQDLTPGVYRLEVKLEGSAGERERRKATVYARVTPAWFEIHRDEALDIFRFVASREELERLEKGSPASWAERVREFWARRDQDPQSPENTFQIEIQSRMEMAAAWFDEPFRRPGWTTDRGRTLLRHGRPDRRTVLDADLDGPARELWEYDSPRLTFLFVDERGVGEYWLRS
jgi:GWxTD domain-containing protein